MSRADDAALPPPGVLGDLVEARAGDTRPFLVDARDGRTLTFADVADACRGWRRRLVGELGAPTGGRVLVRCADPLTTAVALLGIASSGRTAVPVDPRAPASDVARSRRVSAADLALTDADDSGAGWHRIDRVEPHRDGETWLPTDDEELPIPAGGGIALATSGSTGAPKLVQLDERQLVYVATMVARHNALTEDDRGYNPLPLFHINAEVVALLASLVSGATLVLDARFHRTGFFDLLREHEITWVNGVPAIWSILSGESVPEPLPSLRFVRSASAPLPAAVKRWVATSLGVPVVESYGMTEAASQITATPLDGSAPAGSVGRGVGTEVDVRDGRVWIRGPGVVTAYADTPDAPASHYAARFDAAGWLDTGDMGTLDADGFLTLTGRADDVINRGGELVFPREVEEVLHEDRRVRDAVVVGRPDPVLGEVPVAFLVVQPEFAGEADQVADAARARCEAGLSRFKRPVEITVVDDLPRASTGKIKRHEVRA
ncbi:class I adenylate-forming enzyme family protein [Jatrophihabitans sp. YIM 134969]